MFDINSIKAFTFDTGGTILDWHTGFKKGFDQLNFYEKNDFVFYKFRHNYYRYNNKNVHAKCFIKKINHE